MKAVRPIETELPGIVAGRLGEIAELCRRFGVRRLDLFGSAATGRFDPAQSDHYGAVDDGLVWKMIENNLPDLQATIARLLKGAPEP
ncbi:MAG TPA: hypothetical protein VJ770_28985 [Stellaceae bacterium]|nr:hypothetical protein [Stellaceae bacterium]